VRTLPYFEDPQTRDDILDHISGYVFDRAALASNDEPMRLTRYASIADRWHEDQGARKRSVRR
jgi:hypothetical protein